MGRNRSAALRTPEARSMKSIRLRAPAGPSHSLSRTHRHPYSTVVPYLNRRFTDEDFCCRRNGAIGRPLIAELLAKGHVAVALTSFLRKAQALVEQGIEPAIADVFDTDAHQSGCPSHSAGSRH